MALFLEAMGCKRNRGSREYGKIIPVFPWNTNQMEFTKAWLKIDKHLLKVSYVQKYQILHCKKLFKTMFLYKYSKIYQNFKSLCVLR